VSPPVVAVLAGVLMWLAARALPAWDFHLPARIALSIAIGLIGLVLGVVAFLQFRRVGTTPNPRKPHESTALVVAGMYRFSRNPMYLGDVLILAAWALWLANAAPCVFLPLFVAYNTFLTQAGRCCVLGYHSIRSSGQTYAFASYNDAGVFSVPIEDIHALSHELGEWLDDPFVNNATPPWTGGQASGCQANLEVGDPVTGIAFTVVLNDFTYHPEDLVFLAWFARQTPSTAVNGWYTFLNTYTSAPPVCH